MSAFLHIEDILKISPKIPEYGGGKWAMYSIGCCWWTSFPEDLGLQKPVKYDPKTKTIKINPGGFRLPCCPHCGSLLLQAPLEKFISYAQKDPDHYGKFGIEAFLLAHSRNSKNCHPGWGQYNDDIERFFHTPIPPTFA